MSAAAVDRCMGASPRTTIVSSLPKASATHYADCWALPMTGVIVRSTANIDAGARTLTSTVLQGLWLFGFVAALRSLEDETNDVALASKPDLRSSLLEWIDHVDRTETLAGVEVVRIECIAAGFDRGLHHTLALFPALDHQVASGLVLCLRVVVFRDTRMLVSTKLATIV